MERKSAAIIAGILLFSMIGTVLAQTNPRFRIVNSTQILFDVDMFGNVWINQTLTVENISCGDAACIDDTEISDLAASKLTNVPTVWGRGNLTSEIMAPVMTAGYWNDSLAYKIAYTNLTVCGTNQILKESGGAWTCAEDATGVGDIKEAIYPLGNTTNTVYLTDIFLNASGDKVTGNVNFTATANITSEANAKIEFTSDGGIIVRLGA